MSRFIVVLALVVGWTASSPSSASVFSHELAEVPDLPTTLAERATRAIYPGPVQWIFGTPHIEEGGFVSFVKRVRGYFTSDSSISRSAVVDVVDREQEFQGTSALYRDWDSPLPVMVQNRPGRGDIVDIFLGVNLQFFLSRLFSAVLNQNEEALANGREWASWRSILFGADVTEGSLPAGRLPQVDQTTNQSVVLNENGLTPLVQTYLPPEQGSGKPADRSLLAELRENIFVVLSHPLFIFGLMIAALFSFVQKLRRHTTAG
jgi:hypothetical protein